MISLDTLSTFWRKINIKPILFMDKDMSKCFQMVENGSKKLFLCFYISDTSIYTNLKIIVKIEN